MKDANLSAPALLLMWKLRLRVITGGFCLFCAGQKSAEGAHWHAGFILAIAFVCFRLADMSAAKAIGKTV